MTGPNSPDDDFAMKMADIERARQFAADRRERQIMTGVDQFIIMDSPDPQAVRWAARQGMARMLIQSVETPGLEDRWNPLNLSGRMQNRALALRLGLPDDDDHYPALRQFLQIDRAGFIAHEMVPPVDLRKFSEAGLTGDKLTDARRYNAKVQEELDRRGLEVLRLEPFRQRLIDTLDGEASLLASIYKMNTQYSSYEASGGAVDQYAKSFLQPRQMHLLADDFKTIFSAPPTLDSTIATVPLPQELMNKGETESLGVNIDIAMRAYLVVGLSERPEVLAELRTRPGWKKIFPDAAVEREWVGNLDRWTKMSDFRLKGDVRREKDSGLRGKLTQSGNIFARKEESDVRLALRESVRELVRGDTLAEEVAYRMFLLMGLGAKVGTEITYEALKPEGTDTAGNAYTSDDGNNPIRPRNEEEAKPKIDQEGFPVSDSLVQLMNMRAYQLKQHAAGHKAGTPWTRGYYSRLSVDLLSFTVSNKDGNGVSALDEKPNQPTHQRSLMELWWGYPAGAKGIDESEPAKRLGDLPWGELPRDLYRDWMLRVFLAGREGGLQEQLMATTWDPKNLRRDGWEGINLNLNVVVSQSLAVAGTFRGRSSEKIKEITTTKKDRWWKKIAEGIEKEPANQGWLDGTGTLGFATRTGREAMHEYRKDVRAEDRQKIYDGSLSVALERLVEDYISGKDLNDATITLDK